MLLVIMYVVRLGRFHLSNFRRASDMFKDDNARDTAQAIAGATANSSAPVAALRNSGVTVVPPVSAVP